MSQILIINGATNFVIQPHYNIARYFDHNIKKVCDELHLSLKEQEDRYDITQLQPHKKYRRKLQPPGFGAFNFYLANNYAVNDPEWTDDDYAFFKNSGLNADYFCLDSYLIKRFENLTTLSSEWAMLYNEKDYCENSELATFFSTLPLEPQYDLIVYSIPAVSFQSATLDALFILRFNGLCIKYLSKKFNTQIILGGKTVRRVHRNPHFRTTLKHLAQFCVISRKALRPATILPFIGNCSGKRCGRYLNIMDARMSYEFIFRYNGFSVPPTVKSNQYIQQAYHRFSLGCYGKCAFCVFGGLNNYKALSFTELTHALSIYIEEFGINSFYMMNDAINNDKKLSEKLCNWLLRKNYQIKWSDSAKLINSDKDYYTMLFAAGCRSLYFGLESVDNSLLNYIGKKPLTVECAEQALTACNDAGIWIGLNFIVGLPYAPLAEKQLLESFLYKHQNIINRYAVNKFTLYRESRFYREPEKFRIKLLDKQLPISGIVEELPYIELDRIKDYATIKVHKAQQVPDLVEVAGEAINQPLLFALYDVFQSKTKVVQWLKTHKHLCELW